MLQWSNDWQGDTGRFPFLKRSHTSISNWWSEVRWIESLQRTIAELMLINLTVTLHSHWVRAIDTAAACAYNHSFGRPFIHFIWFIHLLFRPTRAGTTEEGRMMPLLNHGKWNAIFPILPWRLFHKTILTITNICVWNLQASVRVERYGAACFWDIGVKYTDSMIEKGIILRSTWIIGDRKYLLLLKSFSSIGLWSQAFSSTSTNILQFGVSTTDRVISLFFLGQGPWAAAGVRPVQNDENK